MRDEQPTVRDTADIELDTVGALSVGEREGRWCVLRRGGRCAPMSQYEHRAIMAHYRRRVPMRRHGSERWVNGW